MLDESMTIAWFGSGPRGASVASSVEMSVCLGGRGGLLIARFMTDEGVGAVLDFMPIERPAYRLPPARPCGPSRARDYALFAGGCAALRLRSTRCWHPDTD